MIDLNHDRDCLAAITGAEETCNCKSVHMTVTIKRIPAITNWDEDYYADEPRQPDGAEKGANGE